MGKEKRTDNSEGLNKSQIGYKRLETDVYIKLPMEWWNHTDCGTNLTGKSYGEQTEIWVGALFSTSQLKEVAAAATANDEYHMLVRDTASELCCLLVWGDMCNFLYLIQKLMQLQITACRMPEEPILLLFEKVKSESFINVFCLDSIRQLK